MNRVCYGCKYFYIQMDEPDYSKVTPGVGWKMACRKSWWKFDAFHDGPEEFAAVQSTAENCPDYQERAK